MNSKQTFYLGTVVKITTTLNIPTPDSIKITVYNSSYAKKVDAADMTKEIDTVYSYVYQSVDDGIYGDYIIHIDATYGSYTARIEDLVTFEPLPSLNYRSP